MTEIKDMLRFNLHAHSKEHSADANISGNDMQKYANDNNLGLIITDHNEFSKSNGILAAEITTQANFGNKKGNFHILAYIPLVRFLDEDTPEQRAEKQNKQFAQNKAIEYLQGRIKELSLTNPKLITYYWFRNLEKYTEHKVVINEKTAKYIVSKYGYFLTYDSSSKDYNNQASNTQHLNSKKAYRILSKVFGIPKEQAKRCGYVVAPEFNSNTLLSAEEVIKTVKAAGGYTVIAHPAQSIKRCQEKIDETKHLSPLKHAEILSDMIDKGSLKGINGIEITAQCINIDTLNILSEKQHADATYKSALYKNTIKVAQDRNLFISYGTDFHGKETEIMHDLIGPVGNSVLYCSILDVLFPAVAEKIKAELIKTGMMKNGAKICVLSEIQNKEDFIQKEAVSKRRMEKSEED